MAIMCLCLMVYGFSQHKLRSVLKEKNDFITNQCNKPTQTPRMQWVYRLFQGIQVLTIQVQDFIDELVINLNPILEQIVRYFGRRAEQIYGLM